jgi:dihydroorotate dehydrogenase electron transfer subunit
MTALQETARVCTNTAEGAFRRVRLRCPALCARLRPGQFVTADLGTALRSPLLPVEAGTETLDVLLPSDHAGATLAPDSDLDLLGPLGRALPSLRSPTRLLLLADAPHLPAVLYAVQDALAAGCPTTLLLSAATGFHLYPPALLPPTLEIHLVTTSGSTEDVAASLAPLPDLLPWANRLLVATEPDLYPSLAELVREIRLLPGPDFAQAFLLPAIVCGVGACRGCAVRTYEGQRCACTDGPFFDLLNLEAQ